MSLRRVKADLTNRQFPFNFRELSSTVVLADARDIPRATPPGFSGQGAEQQAGVPQAYYMENVLPTARGYGSVHFTQVVPPIPDIVGTVHKQFEMRGDAAGLAIMAVTETNQYVFDALTQQWYNVTITNNSYSEIYIANVRDACYILITGDRMYQFNFVDRTLTPVETLGIDIAAMQGMSASGTIITMWDSYNRIYWSSIFDPLDFVPSLATGAGSQDVVAIISKITTIEALGEDFIIYTKGNAVAGRATGDVQFPFIFSEIVGSQGVFMRDHVAYLTNSNTHIIWTGTGFQQVNVEQATYIWPELRDGISRGLNIRLDALTEQPVIDYIAKFDIRLQFCTNNFLCVSLRAPGDLIFKQAYVYDQTLARWGRLVMDHTFIIDNPIVPIFGAYTYGQLESDYATYADLETPGTIYFDIESQVSTGEGPPGTNIGVISADGRVHMAASSETAVFRGDNEGIVAALPRIFFGRYKMTRDEGLYLRGVILNKFFNGTLVFHGHGYNGEYLRKVEDFYEVLEHPGYWTTQIAADSVSIEVTGTFLLSDLLLEGTTSGAQYQFGVPRTKKFYSYINSMPYPVYVVDSAQHSVTLQNAILDDVILFGYGDPESVEHTTTLFAGALRDIAQDLVITPEDDLQHTVVLAAGSLILVARTITVETANNLSHSVSLASGSLITNGLYLTVATENSLQHSVTLSGGSLS